MSSSSPNNSAAVNYGSISSSASGNTGCAHSSPTSLHTASPQSSGRPSISANGSPDNAKRFWGEDKSANAIYSVYTKKIVYTHQESSTPKEPSIAADKESGKTPPVPPTRRRSTSEKRHSSQSQRSTPKSRDKSPSNNNNLLITSAKDADEQGQDCLKWETRRIVLLRAATVDHLLDYILLITDRQRAESGRLHCSHVVLEEERNNVAHTMHVFFFTYRMFLSPQRMLDQLISRYGKCCSRQFKYVLNFWLDNFPEDFTLPYHAADHETTSQSRNSSDKDSEKGNEMEIRSSLVAANHVDDKNDEDQENFKNRRRSRDQSNGKWFMVDQLLHILTSGLDETIYRKALHIMERGKFLMAHEAHMATLQNGDSSGKLGKSGKKTTSIMDLDPKFIANQLTAIDLESFLPLKPYMFLRGSRADSRIQIMIAQFNLLSRHVTVSILKSHSPHSVASLWVEVAHNLRKMKNFNSLKAVIAGLTNESVYRLKSTVWDKLSKSTMATYKWLSSIVDDVDNQTILRQTQLVMEGTAKASPEDESFGTIPYLGTFLTDLTMIDSRYATHVESPQDLNKKLINFEKCCKQFEIGMQIQLLQKNISASLEAACRAVAIERRPLSHADLPPALLSPKTAISLANGSHPTNVGQPMALPRVARLFRNWFNDPEVRATTDNQCYSVSTSLEPAHSKK